MLQFQITNDVLGNKLPFNDAGRKVMQRRVNSLKTGMPFINASARCIPPGQPWQLDLNMPFHIFQTKDRLDFAFEEYHGLLQVAMGMTKARPAAYMGNFDRALGWRYAGGGDVQLQGWALGRY